MKVNQRIYSPKCYGGFQRPPQPFAIRFAREHIEFGARFSFSGFNQRIQTLAFGVLPEKITERNESRDDPVPDDVPNRLRRGACDVGQLLLQLFTTPS